MELRRENSWPVSVNIQEPAGYDTIPDPGSGSMTLPLGAIDRGHAPVQQNLEPVGAILRRLDPVILEILDSGTETRAILFAWKRRDSEPPEEADSMSHVMGMKGVDKPAPRKD